MLLGFGVQGSGFRVSGLGVQGLGFRGLGLEAEDGGRSVLRALGRKRFS